MKTVLVSWMGQSYLFLDLMNDRKLFIMVIEGSTRQKSNPCPYQIKRIWTSSCLIGVKFAGVKLITFSYIDFQKNCYLHV